MKTHQQQTSNFSLIFTFSCIHIRNPNYSLSTWISQLRQNNRASMLELWNQSIITFPHLGEIFGSKLNKTGRPSLVLTMYQLVYMIARHFDML